MPTTGADLKVARVLANLSKTAVAKEMGTTRQTLWSHEKDAQCDADFARRFTAAVAKLVADKETATEDIAA